MQYWIPSPDSLTTIHTWAHLVLATDVEASLVNVPQVAPATETQSSHVSLTTL